MKYLIEPRDQIYVKDHGFLFFAKNIYRKYGQNLLNISKKLATDALKNASKRKIKKVAKTTANLVEIRLQRRLRKLLQKNTPGDLKI